MSVDARKADSVQLASRVDAALAAAEIPPSKLGPARRARLSEKERELYFWILRRFATDGRPNGAELRAAAEQFRLEAERALETLAREDLVHRGADGEVAVAYPFSGQPTAHRVRFRGGHEVDAMCAIDALGIAPMFGESIEIESRDPVSGDEIRARVTPDASAQCSPASAVVVAGAIRSQGGRVLRLLSGPELLRIGRQRRALAGRAPRGTRQRDLDARGGRRRSRRLRRRATRRGSRASGSSTSTMTSPATLTGVVDDRRIENRSGRCRTASTASPWPPRRSNFAAILATWTTRASGRSPSR